MSVPLINPERVVALENPTPEEVLHLIEAHDINRAYIDVAYGPKRFYTQLDFPQFVINLRDSTGTDMPMRVHVQVLKGSGALFFTPHA